MSHRRKSHFWSTKAWHQCLRRKTARRWTGSTPSRVSRPFARCLRRIGRREQDPPRETRRILFHRAFSVDVQRVQGSAKLGSGSEGTLSRRSGPQQDQPLGSQSYRAPSGRVKRGLRICAVRMMMFLGVSSLKRDNKTATASAGVPANQQGVLSRHALSSSEQSVASYLTKRYVPC